MSVRARQEIECRIVLTLIRAIVGAGYFISVDNDEDDPTLPSQHVPTIAGAMMATDDETLVVQKRLLASGSGGFETVGWVKLVYGNEGHDVISNYTDGLQPFVEKTEALANYYAEGEHNSDSGPVMARILAEHPANAMSRDGEVAAYQAGDWVTPIEDPRHIGQCHRSPSTKDGCYDVTWKPDLVSKDIPADKLALHHRNFYHIALSAFQCERIEGALSLTLGSFGSLAVPYSEEVGSGDEAFDTERQEVEVLRDMFKQLEEEDAKTCPQGSLHGFCL